MRLFGGNSDKSVISGSADRSLKIWDISRKTYRQTLTLRHGSSCNCVDVATDSVTAVSGHLDGGRSNLMVSRASSNGLLAICLYPGSHFVFGDVH